MSPPATPTHHAFERALRTVTLARGAWLAALVCTSGALVTEIALVVIELSPRVYYVSEWSIEPAFGPADVARNGAAVALFVGAGWLLARRFRRALEASRERVARLTALASRPSLYRGSCTEPVASPERRIAAHAGQSVTRLALTVAASQLLVLVGVPPMFYATNESWAWRASLALNAALMALGALVVLVRSAPTQAQMLGPR